MNCTITSPSPDSGKVAVRTLGTADGSHYVEIGYDFGTESFYANHSLCCAVANTIVQRAPLPRAKLLGTLMVTVLVDGGVIEAFSTGLAISPLVAPDPGATAEVDRVTSAVNTAPDATCVVDSWQLMY